MHVPMPLPVSVGVYRGPFEQHKIILSFVLCIEIVKQNCSVSDAEWNYFLRGSSGVERVRISPFCFFALCSFMHVLQLACND